MMEALFILSNSRRAGDDFAKKQPFIGESRIIVVESEAAEYLRPGTSPAVVLIIDELTWPGWQRVLRAMRVRSIDLRGMNI
jgi:hypothetical protein